MSIVSTIKRFQSPKARVAVAVAVVIGLAGFTMVARKLGYSGMGANTTVRCRHGHLFTTIWVPGASLKSLRLGWFRYQYCPVGRHWALVTPVKDSDMSEEERRLAAENRDIRIP